MNLSLYELIITAGVDVPKSWKEIKSHDEKIIGWNAPNGAIIKPCIIFEEEKDGMLNDLEENELVKYGLSYEYRETSLEPEEIQD